MEENRLNNHQQENTFFENEKLVYYVVKNLMKLPKDSDYEDIISVGKIGLIKAVQTYDESRGNKFTTYASKCIKNEIYLYFRKEKKKNRCISMEEAVSIDIDGKELSIEDTLSAPNDSVLENIEEQNTLEEIINIIINVLKKNEREIIKHKIHGKTHREIGEIFNWSQSYIGRVITKATTKIKNYYTNNTEYEKKYEVTVSEGFYKLFINTKEKERINIATISKSEPDALIRIITIVDLYKEN